MRSRRESSRRHGPPGYSACPGPLAGREIWLDGGHNADAGRMLGTHFAGQQPHLVLGMLDADPPRWSILAPRSPALPWSRCRATTALVVDRRQRFFPDIVNALAAIPEDGLPVLIAGSLYLAGDVLRRNGEAPNSPGYSAGANACSMARPRPNCTRAAFAIPFDADQHRRPQSDPSDEDET